MRSSLRPIAASFLAISSAVAACGDAAGIPIDAADTVVSDVDDTRDATTATDSTTTTSTPTDVTTTSTTSATDSATEAEVGPPSIGRVTLQYPPTQTAAPGETFQVYGRVFVAGVTPAAGAGAGLEAEAGVGGGIDVRAWTWTAAAFNLDADQADDEWLATITAPATDGGYRYAFRFRLDGGEWVYADRTGSEDGFDLDDTGELTVVSPTPAAVDWCTIQHPSSISGAPGLPVGTIYGRAYEAGMTDTLASTDPGYTLRAELGYGQADDAAAWTWIPATWARDVDNDDEFEATFLAPDVLGTWRYAFRFRIDEPGAGDWVYCDLNGTENGFTPDHAGTLVVQPPIPQVVDYAIVRPPTVAWSTGETPGSVVVVVYEEGITDQVGLGQGVGVDLGVGSPSADPEDYLWFGIPYTRDEAGLGANDNDVYEWMLSSLGEGEHRVIARVRIGAGQPTLVDATGTADGFAVADATQVTVTPSAPPSPDWCRLLSAERVTLPPGASVGPIAVQIFEAGLTPHADPALVAEIGYGVVGTDPGGSGWTWSAAPFDRVDGNDDVHQASFVAPALAGSWDVAARVALSAGGAWRTCDRDGSADGYEPSQATTLVLQSPRLDFCRIQWPLAPVTVGAGLETPDLFVLLYEPGVTGETGSHVPAITTEVGFGATGTAPDASWTWVAGTFNGYLDNGFGQKTNDEHRGRLTPPTAGTYAWGWRASLDGGASWLYCDEAGSQPFDPTKAGELVVTAP